MERGLHLVLQKGEVSTTSDNSFTQYKTPYSPISLQFSRFRFSTRSHSALLQTTASYAFIGLMSNAVKTNDLSTNQHLQNKLQNHVLWNEATFSKITQRKIYLWSVKGSIPRVQFPLLTKFIQTVFKLLVKDDIYTELLVWLCGSAINVLFFFIFIAQSEY